MVFVAMKGNAMVSQRAAHLGVARKGLGLVVVVPKYSLCAQGLRQRWYFLRRPGVAHDQATAGLAAQLEQLGMKLHQALADELHAPVGARQGVQNLAVEHKGYVNLRAAFQGVVERGVILRAQVAA
jgi:hypothetical protein